MSGVPAIPQATKLAQTKATNPHGSAWVSANAGSGKTFVLTRRVLRLLLDRQDPATLLCLTFTKAAATEMASRVFDELARWTRLDDAALGGVLADLQGRAGSKDIAHARELFARALETPGGLKIQTIHAFCESLLHQFPFEAGIAAAFTVLDDRDADALMQAARADVITRAAKGDDPALALAFDGLLARFADSSLNDHLDAILKARHGLVRQLEAAGIEDFDSRLEHLARLHAQMLGLEDASEKAARTALHDPIATSPYLPKATVEAWWHVAREEGTATDKNRIEPLWMAHNGPTRAARYAGYIEGLFNTSGAPRATGSKSLFRVKDAFPEALDAIAAEQDRFANLQAHIAYVDLMRMALTVLERFDALKNRRGALDFGDLIACTAALLTRSGAQAWVRYKMDQRINHVLVDEAQDTSVQQWAIIRALTDDFFDGHARRQTITPTFFAVGDDKQSIYSFQGADPRHFYSTRRALETKAAHANAVFDAQISLLLSFRSTPDVLRAVDKVFERDAARGGVTLDRGLVHEPYRGDPGQVELWPVIRSIKADEPPDWTAPVDALPAAHLQLAQAIAGRIRSLVDSGQNPGDILILLRTRGAMADSINRALKERGIAVAGTDRLLLTDHIAVEDMMALMQVALLPEDDLSLATLLTSPLVGLSDEQLEALAADRPGLLIDALNNRTDDPAIRQAALDVARWRAMADYASPFTFLATVLGRDGGRKRMLARLGEDARDPLDELLRLARAEETRQGVGSGAAPASLEAFLDTLRRIHLDIKRDMDARADKVRIMTVHGSKGLEAKTVFLVDTCRLPRAPSGIVETGTDTIDGPEKPPLLLLASDIRAPAYQMVRQSAAQRQQEEYRRLLYVAMTRARDQLIVTGHMTGEKDVPKGCWYDLIDQALGSEARDVGDLEGSPDDLPVRVWRASPWPSQEQTWQEQTWQEKALHEKAWDRERASTNLQTELSGLKSRLEAPLDKPNPPAPLRPSTARGDSQRHGATWHDVAHAQRHARTVERLDQSEPSRALLFGTLVHRMLETAKPPDADDATAMARALSDAPDESLVQAALHQAAAVHAMGQAAELYGPSARGEVPIRGHVRDRTGALRPVSGSIDRLVVRKSEVWAIDFKTNTRIPDSLNLATTVPDYTAQMALYGHLLGELFPDKKICCGLLWTAAPRLDWLASCDLLAALTDLGIAQA